MYGVSESFEQHLRSSIDDLHTSLVGESERRATNNCCSQWGRSFSIRLALLTVREVVRDRGLKSIELGKDCGRGSVKVIQEGSITSIGLWYSRVGHCVNVVEK